MNSSLYQIDKLGEDNYDTWCVQMQCILRHSELWLISSGKILKPVDAADATKWELLNEKALTTIFALC